MRKATIIISVVIGLGLIGSIFTNGSVDNSQPAKTPGDLINDEVNKETVVESSEVVPITSQLNINSAEYIGKESLAVYHELVSLGYSVEATYKEADATNEIQLSVLNDQLKTLGTLNPSIEEDRLSVDAFTIDGIEQVGNNIRLIIVTVAKDENGDIDGSNDCANYSPELATIICN